MDEATPTPTEAELKAILAHRTSGPQALRAGLRLASKTAVVGVPLALGYGLVSGLVGYAVLQAAIATREADAAVVELAVQIVGLAAVLAIVYAIVQFGKRATASRASWWPALFAAPLLLLTIALSLIQSGQAQQIGPVVLSLFMMAWSLVWMSFGGAATAIGWVVAGNAAAEGRPLGLGEALDAIRSRLFDVAGPHGARVHAVTIGMQLLLPGIFYALQLAFTDMVAVLDPDRPALRRAGQLSTGMRGRLFRMMLLWWVVGMLFTSMTALPLEGVTSTDGAMEKLSELLIDPSAPSQITFVVQEVLWALLGWVLTLALLVLYLEREAQVRAKTALRALNAPPPKANPYAPPAQTLG